MWKIVILLLFTLVGVPVLTFYFDAAPGADQWALLRSTYILCLVVAGVCFFASSLTRNYSQVDKLWSIMPIVYAWMVWEQVREPRILLMAVLITLWGVRLTYNFARRGGYSWRFWEGEEDYRWSILRSKPEFQPRWRWILFNLFFISFYQMSLIWMMTIPIVKSVDGSILFWADYLLFALGAGCILLETIADQQQWNYQQEKRRRQVTSELKGTKYARGFVHDGLWGLMRHPNYFAEQAFWVAIYGFSIAATGAWINWSIAGCLLLIALFRGSSNFSEEISASKYPEYADYQSMVPRFIPLPRMPCLP